MWKAYKAMCCLSPLQTFRCLSGFFCFVLFCFALFIYIYIYIYLPIWPLRCRNQMLLNHLYPEMKGSSNYAKFPSPGNSLASTTIKVYITWKFPFFFLCLLELWWTDWDKKIERVGRIDLNADIFNEIKHFCGFQWFYFSNCLLYKWRNIFAFYSTNYTN